VLTPEGEKVLTPDSTYCFSNLLTGILPIGKKIKYSFQQDIDGKWQSANIHIKPNEAFLVNLEPSNKGVATYRPDLLQEASLPEDELKRLAAEISAGQPPEAASALFSYAAKHFKDVYAGQSSESIFRSRDYDFRQIPTGTNVVRLYTGKNSLILSLNTTLNLPFSNGIIEFKPNGDISKLNIELRLDSMSINGQTIEIPTARFSIFTNENKLLCIAVQPDTKCKLNGQNTPVTIDYSAHKNMAGEWIQQASYK